MMLAIFENVDLAALQTLLVGIPESAGLLAFGVGLVMFAVFIRRLLAKAEDAKTEEKQGKRASIAV